MKLRIISLFAVVAMSLAAADNQANALVRLLNSRASGSPKGYADAAAEVAAAAAEGKPLQRFVLAIVSRDKDAPEAARIDEATREEYLNSTRERIEKLAMRTNNALAWYLLSLDRNDTNLLQRAALGGNVQALNAWGAMLVNNAVMLGGSTNEIDRALGEALGYFKQAAGQGDAMVHSLVLLRQTPFSQRTCPGGQKGVVGQCVGEITHVIPSAQRRGA